LPDESAGFPSPGAPPAPFPGVGACDEHPCQTRPINRAKVKERSRTHAARIDTGEKTTSR
jgi:hypothetical protein